MIDCHVLHMPGENPVWAEKCAQSIASTTADVTVHHAPGIDGDWFEARRRGFRLGTAPFVSFVDPDDEVLGGGFERCLERLLQPDKPVAVFTRSFCRNADNSSLVETGFNWPHQLIVARREAVLEALDFVNSDKELTLHLSRVGLFPRIDWFGYVWRDHPAGLHRGFRMRKSHNLSESMT
jgi:hypothetical protein